MFGLKIFVRLQTFRRRPFVPSHNLCHPAERHSFFRTSPFWLFMNFDHQCVNWLEMVFLYPKKKGVFTWSKNELNFPPMNIFLQTKLHGCSVIPFTDKVCKGVFDGYHRAFLHHFWNNEQIDLTFYLTMLRARGRDRARSARTRSKEAG